MKKPKKSDFKNCQDPEFAYIDAMYYYEALQSVKNNPFLKWINSNPKFKNTK